MSRTVFQDVYDRAKNAGALSAKSRESIDWFRTAARKYKNNISFQKLQSSAGTAANTSRVRVGGMFMFTYNAKYQEELDYWDRVPLIIPFREDATHFWGINFHYAPPIYRAVIMDNLYNIMENPNITDIQKEKLTYKMLQAMSSASFIQPLIKCYLKGHVTSQFIRIEPELWNVALFLPTQQFQKQSVRKVYSDYYRKIK